jgi:hypothetical protein
MIPWKIEVLKKNKKSYNIAQLREVKCSEVCKFSTHEKWKPLKNENYSHVSRDLWNLKFVTPNIMIPHTIDHCC